MFLLSDLLIQVRELVLDEVVPYRYSDDRIFRTLNNAYVEAYRIRPDIFVDLDFQIPFVTAANSPDPFQLDQQFYNAFVDYTVSMIEFSDDEWTVDGRAIGYLTLFNQRLGGKSQ